MSRTYKDKPSKASYLDGTEKIPCVRSYIDWESGEEVYRNSYWYKDIPGFFPKKRKEKDTENHWMSTPSWWTRLMMGRPERRQAHINEVAVLKALDIEDFDFPDLKRKPHIYYW